MRFQNDITPYLGYCWKSITIFVESNNNANPNIPYHVLFLVVLRIAIIIVTISAPIDKNNPTGNTALNLLSALSVCSAFIHTPKSVGKPMTLSQSIINIPKGTMAKLNAKNNISIRIFLFSILGIFLRNNVMARKIPNTIPPK